MAGLSASESPDAGGFGCSADTLYESALISMELKFRVVGIIGQDTKVVSFFPSWIIVVPQVAFIFVQKTEPAFKYWGITSDKSVMTAGPIID